MSSEHDKEQTVFDKNQQLLDELTEAANADLNEEELPM
jgi:hypothetical protein